MAEPKIPHVEEFHVSLDDLVHHTELPQTQISQRIDTAIDRIGAAIAWVWVLLMVVIIVNVVMRYVLGRGLIVFEEIQWHIYSVGFLIAFSYCLVHDDHVRVDILHDRMKLRTQAWVEFLGLLIFLLPFVTIVTWDSLPFVYNAFVLHERSDAPGGLPYRWVIKAVLPIAFALLWLAAFSRLLRTTALLFGRPRPISRPKVL